MRAGSSRPARAEDTVAHSQLNGLICKVISDGTGNAQINATAKDTALELLAGPLAASTLVEFMVPWLGWDATALNASIPAMFDLWGQIAGAPYPGPVSDGAPARPRTISIPVATQLLRTSRCPTRRWRSTVSARS
jgi:hypothetical protein